MQGGDFTHGTTPPDLSSLHGSSRFIVCQLIDHHTIGNGAGGASAFGRVFEDEVGCMHAHSDFVVAWY